MYNRLVETLTCPLDQLMLHSGWWCSDLRHRGHVHRLWRWAIQMLIWLSITFSMGTLQMCHAIFMLDGGDLNHNHFHGHITDEPCQMLVIWILSLISWVHYILAMLDVGDLNLSQWFSGYFADEPCQMLMTWISVTDSVGILQMSPVRWWSLESQSVIQWVLCRWTKCWQCCHGVSPSHRRSSCCQCWGKSFKEAGTPGWCLALIRSDSYCHRKTNIGLEYRYKAV